MLVLETLCLVSNHSLIGVCHLPVQRSRAQAKQEKTFLREIVYKKNSVFMRKWKRWIFLDKKFLQRRTTVVLAPRSSRWMLIISSYQTFTEVFSVFCTGELAFISFFILVSLKEFFLW